jgi:hypothetical protein
MGSTSDSAPESFRGGSADRKVEATFTQRPCSLDSGAIPVPPGESPGGSSGLCYPKTDP